MTTVIAPFRGRAKSATRQTLLGLLAGLLTMTMIVFGTTLLAFIKVYGTADTVRTRTAPAIVQLAIARAALVKADNAAINSFRNCDPEFLDYCVKSTGSLLETDAGVPHLAGPGEGFRYQIAIAIQSLTRVAEDNVVGEVGSGTLQVVEGLLVIYSSLIENAFRKAAGGTLGVLDLSSASRVLHKRDGILAQLDMLLVAQQGALKGQLSTSSKTARFALVFLVLTTCGLFALLVVAQIFLRRRFRRRANLWLALATVLLVVLSMISSAVFVSQHGLEVSGHTLDQLMTDGPTQTSATDAQGQHWLRQLVRDACATPGCPTAEQLVPKVQAPGWTSSDVNDRWLTAASRIIGDQAAAADANAGLEPLVYILAILIAAAVFLGFRPRLYEYRYRSR